MECRILDLVLVSAKGLEKSRLNRKKEVYAVVSISGVIGKGQKLRTCTHNNGDSDPTWNFPMKFIVDDGAGLQNQQTLVVKIKEAVLFGSRKLGQVHVPVKDLLEDVKAQGKARQSVSYQVIRPSGKPRGVLRLSYEFGEKIPVTVYPPQPLPSRMSNSGGGGCGFGCGCGAG